MSQAEAATQKLPDVKHVGIGAPLDWLAGGWSDFMRSFGASLTYGLILSAISLGIVWALLFSGAANWVMVAIGGFFLVAPMLGMGLYEAGRQLELGQQPRLVDMLLVRTASPRCLAYLGLALLLVYFFWGRMAQLIYALSTYRVHETVEEFFTFMFTTQKGINMAITGTVVGGVIAFIAYALVVISAPMLLERKSEVFVATITSVRAVFANPGPMLLWAFLIALLVAIGVATACIGLAIVFPVIGLGSWRAYRDLVDHD